MTKTSGPSEFGAALHSLPTLICAATSWEALPIVKALHLKAASAHSFFGKFGGRSILLLKTGIGEEALRKTLATLPHGVLFSRVISTGFCGALKRNVCSSDIICDLGTDNAAAMEICRQIAAIQKKNVHFGSFAHSSIVLASPDLKKSLAESSGSLAVDMETAPLRAWAKETLPTVEIWGVRAVLDNLDDRLPQGLPQNENLLAHSFYALSRPGDWPLFLQIYLKQKKAARALAQFLSQLIEK